MHSATPLTQMFDFDNKRDGDERTLILDPSTGTAGGRTR